MIGAHKMADVSLPFICMDVDRHGNVRIYFRRRGQRKVRIHARLGTPEFLETYNILRRQSDAGELRLLPQGLPVCGTFRWLCLQYMSSTKFRELDPRTQHVRRQIIESMWSEPIEPGSGERFADFPIERMTAKAVRVLRDRKANTPEAANVRVKTARVIFSWALDSENEIEGVTENPARDVKFLKPKRQGGHHSWTVDEVGQYEARHPLGTPARLALALLLYTGQRRSDIVQFGRQHVRDGFLQFTQHKNRNRRPIRLELPILPALQEAMDAGPTGDLTFLINELGRAFTANGFGNKMRQWCNEAGLPHCSAHGLRKAGAALAAENGTSVHELMSIFGWLTSKEADRYTRAADQKRLAARAMNKLERSSRTDRQ
jgi:integrase